MYVWKGFEYNSAAVFISYIVIKKHEDKALTIPICLKIFQRRHLLESYPCFLGALTKMNEFKNIFTYPKLF